MEGERRQVTVLFGDIAGFTAMAEKLDPEEVSEIISRGFELVTAEIHRFEGTIIEYGGDGFMALFGAPIAHEDAARRGVHAALAIQRALSEYGKELEQKRGLRLQMRIGLNSGIVVVGKIGDDLHMEYTAIGDTTNLTSRLQTAASPGSVLISEATYKQISGFFEALEMGEISVKGHAPVRAFEVKRATARRGRLQVAAERGLTPLVGRERELAALDDLFQLVKAGHGQVVFVAGEAGIGKSRLLLEFRRRLAAAGEKLTWLEGRCVSFGQSIPLLPIVDQLRENFGIDEIDGEPEIIAKVEQGMHALGGVESEIPYVRYLLSVDPGDPAVAAMDASERRTRLFRALRVLALRGAKQRPLVMVFEDLHWIDASTKEYLDFFMDSVAGAALMPILTHRVGYVPSFGSRSFYTAMSLHHLSGAETFEMAKRMLGTDQFPQTLMGTLTEKAEGVPLFVEEVTKTLIDLGFLIRENGGYQMAKALDEVGVPGTMQDIIMARLDRLGVDGKRAVQLASVIGRQFMAKLLERVAGLTGRLEGLLRELKALEIIYEQGLAPEPAYIFKHAVIQDVAYNSLLIQRRKELHRAVGEAIEELYCERLSEHYAELAHHFTRGEEWSKAIHYSTLAGDQASHSFSNREAEDHYSRALEVASKLPLAEPGLVADLHAKRGAVLNTVGRHDEAIAEYERAREIATSAGDDSRKCRALLGLVDVYFNAHRRQPIRDCADEALRLAREIGDTRLEASCLASRVIPVGSWEGPTQEVMEDAKEAVRLAQVVGDPRLLAAASVGLGGVLQWRAEFSSGLEHLRKGIELAQSTHDGRALGIGLFHLGHLRLSQGDYEEALRVYGQMRDYAQGAEDRFFLARVPNLLGAVHLELYDLEEALALNLEGEEAGRRFSPWPEPLSHSLLKVGLVHLQRCDYDLAEKFFLRAWDLLQSDELTRWRWHIPLLRARGELALARGHHDEAWSFAGQSLDLATKNIARKHIARAQRLQGEVLVATGKLQDAAGVLESSVTLVAELKAAPDLWQCGLALGKVLLKLGREGEAETQLNLAAGVVEAIAQKLTTPSLRRSFLSAGPVLDVYALLHRPPPQLG